MPAATQQERINIRDTLEGEMARRLRALQHYYGVKAAVEMLRMLITLEYERIARQTPVPGLPEPTRRQRSSPR